MWVVNAVKGFILGTANRGASVATITLGDRDRELRVVLDPSLPDDAYQQLFHVDLALVPAGILTWDPQSRGWYVT